MSWRDSHKVQEEYKLVGRSDKFIGLSLSAVSPHSSPGYASKQQGSLVLRATDPTNR